MKLCTAGSEVPSATLACGVQYHRRGSSYEEADSCIDYRRRQLTLAHPDLGVPPQYQGAALPLVFFEHFPALNDLEVEGRRIPLATIDTGSNGALTVGPDLAEALGLLPGADGVRPARGAGFGFGPASFASNENMRPSKDSRA